MGVMAAMQKLKKAIGGFHYEISIHPETNRLNGVFWAFPEQRWDLSHYGMLLFVDGTHGTTHHDWPLFTPCVLDSFNRLRAVGYCLVDSECGPAQSWMLQCMVRAEPLSKLAEDSITPVFPEAKVFLCWWHIVHRSLVYDISKFFLHVSLLKV